MPEITGRTDKLEIVWRALVVYVGALLGLGVGNSLAFFVMASTGNVMLIRVLAAMIFGLASGLLSGGMFGKKGALIAGFAPLFIVLTRLLFGHADRTGSMVIEHGQISHVVHMHTDYLGVVLLNRTRFAGHLDRW